MKVSVIIPVYNVAKYIERCLLSVLNQTWQDLEIILVNDCTPDNSMEIAEKVIASHSRGGVVRCLAHEQNRGQSAARNTAIRVATGYYLYFVDSDDYLPLDSISTLMGVGMKSNYDFISGNYEIVGRARSIPSLKMNTGPLLSNNEILSAYAHDMWTRTVWNMLIRREFVLSEGLFFEEGIIHEDDLWTFILACKARSAYFINEVTYYYYTHFHSTTGNPTLWNLQCRVHIIELMHNYILTSKSLEENRYVYITFEEAKAKYFDRILYFTQDESFHFRSYQIFREKKYLSYFKAMMKMKPGIKLMVRNLHYCLPLHFGYVYFKVFVQMGYYWKILPIKIKQFSAKASQLWNRDRKYQL